MKQFFKMFFASLLAMVVAGVVLIVIFISSIVALVAKAKEKEKKTEANTVLVVNLSKTYHELGERNSIGAIFNENTSTSGLYDITRAIAQAKTDNNVKGIYIKLEAGGNGWASKQQIRMALEDFKKSGKFIYAYGEEITQGTYYVGSIADSVYLNPIGGMQLKGFATTLAFFKGTLDKLEIQPEIFFAGKFKSATEPFRADKMSDANKLQTIALQHSFWNEFIKAVMQHTHSDSNTINQLTQTGAVQFAEDALRNKLVDGLLYFDQVEDRIKAKTGQAAKDKINYMSIDDYAQDHRDTKISDNRIAVLYAEGNIVDGENTDDFEIASKTFIESIRKVRDDEKIKVVVLRVNSPGGSALASELILRELQLLKAKKPLIVSMGDLAASGGYYIACQADSVFALPNTITGSIGVFGMMFNIDKMMKNKLGVTFDGVKTAPYADFPAGTRPLTPDEAARMQKSVDNIYTIFKSRVSVGRHLSLDVVDSLAQGHVYSGTDALKLGLVDRLGNLDVAITSAAAKANLKNYKIVSYPEPIDKFQNMLKKMRSSGVSEEIVKQSVKQQLGSNYEWYKQLKNFSNMNGKVQMAMPFVFNIQ